MPRKPRFYVPNIPVHVIQRGNNRNKIFFDDSDYAYYLEVLGEAMERYNCTIHAYVLMTNHVHIIATPGDYDSISRMMQFVGLRYVPYFNHKQDRTGTLWEGRYKACLIQDDTYLLTCMRYIELNPLRAKIVKTVKEYPWSSYSANAYGRKNTLVQVHSVYQSLGSDEKSRRQNYRNLFKQKLKPETLQEIRASLQSGTPLGDERFKKKVEKKLKLKVGHVGRGRPKSPTNQ